MKQNEMKKKQEKLKSSSIIHYITLRYVTLHDNIHNKCTDALAKLTLLNNVKEDEKYEIIQIAILIYIKYSIVSLPQNRYQKLIMKFKKIKRKKNPRIKFRIRRMLIH